MKRVTALTIKNSYPEKIQISPVQDNDQGNWAVKVFLLDKGKVKTLLLESQHVFKNHQMAANHAKAVCESIVNDKNL